MYLVFSQDTKNYISKLRSKHMLKRVFRFSGGALALVILLVVLAAPALTQDTTTTLEQLRQYRIIYLVDPTSELAPEADSLRSPSKLEEEFGAIVVTTWEEVLEAHETAPLDALIIDVSALPLVETQ